MTEEQAEHVHVENETHLDFETEAEPWAIVHVADGTRLRVKIVITSVSRLEGQTDQEGHPLYRVTYETFVRVAEG